MRKMVVRGGRRVGSGRKRKQKMGTEGHPTPTLALASAML